MGNSWFVSFVKRRNYMPICIKKRPVFFTKEQEERMSKTPGSYQWKG